MCSPKMPEPPSPYETGMAQTQTNIDTAIANNRMGLVDQVTPYGSLTYETIYDQPMGQPQGQSYAPQAPSQAPSKPQMRERYNEATGKYEMIPVGGAQPAQSAQPLLAGGFTGMNVPRYRATTTLSPGQQRILDASTGAKGNLAELAQERSAFLKDYLPNATPESIDKKLYELGSQRLDPRFARDEEALRSRLANQGLTQGSGAWDAEMERFGQNRNDAYNQLVLNGRGQALAEINNPINQIAALLGLGQVQNPQVQMQQPSQMPTVDQAGLINDNYNARLRNAQQKAQYNQGLLGGLFDIGSAGIGGGFF
jgi:hypothetical protein